jgi:hypothetical protein
MTIPDRNYVYVQSIPAAVWDVTHNLNKMPIVTVTDSNDDEVEGDVQFVTKQRVLLTFAGSFSGRAVFN